MKRYSLLFTVFLSLSSYAVTRGTKKTDPLSKKCSLALDGFSDKRGPFIKNIFSDDRLKNYDLEDFIRASKNGTLDKTRSNVPLHVVFRVSGTALRDIDRGLLRLHLRKVGKYIEVASGLNWEAAVGTDVIASLYYADPSQIEWLDQRPQVKALEITSETQTEMDGRKWSGLMGADLSDILQLVLPSEKIEIDVGWEKAKGNPLVDGVEILDRHEQQDYNFAIIRGNPAQLKTIRAHSGVFRMKSRQRETPKFSPGDF